MGVVSSWPPAISSHPGGERSGDGLALAHTLAMIVLILSGDDVGCLVAVELSSR